MTVVLDAWAIVALVEDEPAAPQIEEAVSRERTLVSTVNLGEALYVLIRKHGSRRAKRAVEEVREELEGEDPDWPLVAAAADLKAGGSLSYADAFAVATAARHGAELWTGDPEILALQTRVRRVDLR